MARMAILKGDKNVSELASRLFKLKAGETQASGAAIDSLVKANPQLSDLGQLPAGSAVLVPDTAAGPDAAETLPPAGLSAVNTSRIATAVATFAGALGTASDSATAQADNTLAVLKDRTLTAAIAKDPDLAQRVSAIVDGARATLKDLEAQKASLQNGIAQLQSDLANFLKLEPINLQSAAQPPASAASPPAKAAPAPASAPTVASAPTPPPASPPSPAASPKGKARRTKTKK
jgi:phage tail protein X